MIGSSGRCEWTRFAELRDAGGYFQDENNPVWAKQQGERRETLAVVQIAILLKNKRRNATV